LLETFSTTGFRNLAPQTLFFPPGLTLLLGENGAGKTNILEGIAVLAGRSSFRQSRLSEMVRADEDAFHLRGTLQTGQGQEELRVEWCRGGARSFERRKLRSHAGEAAELLPAVFLAPEDRALFEGAPSVRRRSLDRLAVSLFPLAHEDYTRFHRSLAQRNALLASGNPDAAALEAWTEEFVRCAQRVLDRRKAVLGIWQSHFSRIFSGAGPLSGLAVRYRSDAADSGSEDTLRAQAAALRRSELARGHSLFGPQRDDLEFVRDGRLFAPCASSGEIKKAAFFLRISEGVAVAEVRGLLPLYALDDFDADLSPRAAESLLGAVPEGAQTLLTTARPEAVSFCPRPPDRLYEVDGGTAAPEPARQQLRKTG
jgi:DNA replication and repair protein RecF